ncbi:MAG TPA: aminotransferase class V-fold PLP-dependent enzyme [Actinomycetota bacterium]|nr:aminotransferase class V-fold PLP-dependent enzyme [Actinomycetota bacterium]
MSGDPTERATALAMDAEDPLAPFRDQFHVADPHVCYLDGNSLGRLPVATIAAVNELLLDEWGGEVVDGWSHWIDEARTTGDLVGRATLGAAAGQTLVQDTTSVNFYQLCMAAITARPGRRTVIIDSANFPTDRYILAGIAGAMGLRLITLDNDGTGGPGAVSVDSDCELISASTLERHLGEDVALVTLQVVQYRSGARQDVAAITDLVRSHGGLVVWDAAHAAGSVELAFDDWGVDLAVGCTYKYGNSGPGAPAWLYVNRSVQEQLRVPIQGWFANQRQFEMGPHFEPAVGIRRFQVATPAVMGLRAVQTSYRMIEQAGMAAIAEKARLGTELMITLFDRWLAPLGFSLLTPRDPALRGGHITVAHPHARQIASAMRTLTKTIPDYRVPDSIRLAISPLPTSYTEVWDGFDRLRDLVSSGRYLDAPDTGGRVT